jgi:hypothetical protein
MMEVEVRKILVILFFLCVTNAYTEIISKEYYEIKAKLPEESEDNSTYGGTINDKERDLPVLDSLIKILNTYSYSKELEKERYYLQGAVMTLLPHEQEDAVYRKSYINDFPDYVKKKRKYYMIFKSWGYQTAVELYVESGVPRKTAVKIVDALSLMRKDKTYRKGKLICEKMFKKGVLKISFMTSYFDNLSEKDKTSNIYKIYNLYFDKIEPEEFILKNSEMLLFKISFYIKDENARVVFAEKVMKKYNEIKSNKEDAVLIGMGMKNVVLNILADKSIVSALKPKVIDFINENKILTGYKEDDTFYLKKETLDFINDNKNELMLNEKALIKINAIPKR